MRIRVVVALLFAGAASAHANTYEVGPGKQFAAIGDVPIETLKAGDVVAIFWRDTPYREKFVVGNQGTASAPITIRGVPGPGGALPIIDGQNATTRAQLKYHGQPRHVVKIGGSTAPAGKPSHIVIEKLDIRGGHPSNTFRDTTGATVTYATNAAAIMIEDGNHITIRDCILRDSANGLFSANGSSTVLVDGNYFHDNGVSGNGFVHSSYTESNGLTFQYNRMGPLAPGAGGNNIKDRSAGLVVRYNWIEGGGRQLDLVDSEFFATLPAFRTTHVYGNVMIELNDSTNRQIVHYGGDSDDENPVTYRKGTLYFYNNTVVSKRANRTTLFRLSTIEESADVRNNIFYATSGGQNVELSAKDGNVTHGFNWHQPNWVRSFDTMPRGTITDLGGRVEGTDPGFVALATQDLHLAAASPARNKGGALAAGTQPMTEQYAEHQRHFARPSDGPADIGAFEFCGTSCAPAGGAPGDPSDPSDPTDPNDPNDPGDPNDPNDPSSPGAGGDGGGCRTGGSGSPLALLALGLLWARRRKRA